MVRIKIVQRQNRRHEMDFKNSETKTNLMRAFAGESQARNRYTFAASQAKKEKLYVKMCIRDRSWSYSVLLRMPLLMLILI